MTEGEGPTPGRGAEGQAALGVRYPLPDQVPPLASDFLALAGASMTTFVDDL